MMAADEERRGWMGRAGCLMVLVYWVLFMAVFAHDPWLRSLLPGWLGRWLRRALR